jgi:copper chaperone
MITTYLVPGISCDHCKHAIETEVGALATVDEVTVDVGEKTVRVHGDASVEDVRAAIDTAGYDVEQVVAT